jgi:hypothetical protein
MNDQVLELSAFRMLDIVVKSSCSDVKATLKRER